MGHGHTVSGLVTFLSAKVAGTALFAGLFSLTKPALLQIGWFTRAYGWVNRLSTAAHEWLHRQVIFQAMKALVKRIRHQISHIFYRNR
jgi:hypothetical protein